MVSMIVCKDCRRIDPRKQFYSYEFADRSGVFDRAWNCPTCGGSEFVFVSAPASDPALPLAALRRVEAVLRVVEVNGGPRLEVTALDREALLDFDAALCALIEQTRARIEQVHPEVLASTSSDQLARPGAPSPY
ncbi:MAG: hypothetical protein KatS3mg061_0852 [Dehalococcoidia bacterium]|nr:MAG: hypothetical protein KatS3mg061_0852 [Dehalococcoidia bacterium]